MKRPRGLLNWLVLLGVLLGAGLGTGTAAAQMAHTVVMGTPGDDT